MNIRYFSEPQKLNQRQTHWETELQAYNFKLHHRPGKLNVVADSLSRKHEPKGGGVENVETFFLKPERFASDVAINRLSFRDEEEIVEEVRRRHQQQDSKVALALINKDKDYKETNGVIEYKGLVYVPKDKTLREHILYAYHNMPIAGHPGQKGTAALIRRNWWWPTLTSDAAKYVAACEVCQRTKVQPGPLAGPLNPHDAPDAPWDVITADMIGPLPKSRNYNAIFVVVDKLTKMIIAVPTTTTLTAQGTARIFQNHVFKRFGVPKKIISD